MTTLFKGRLKSGSFEMVCLFDAEGRLLHLHFAPEPGRHFFLRFQKYVGRFKEKEAPFSWEGALQKVLEGYFSGRLKRPSFPLLLLGTPFEKQVWEIVKSIPYGEVRTYSWVAERLGNPGARRAVGRALAANPVPIFVPCHRIVARHGPGGFSQGLKIKRKLLLLEGALRQ